jgi:hypothetical protein
VSTLEDKIVSVLKNDAIVSGIVSDRIYPLMLRQEETKPSLTYQRIDTPRMRSLDGYEGMEIPRIQIDCYANHIKDARILRDAVIRAMEGALSFSAGCDNYFDNDVEIEVENLKYRITMDFIIVDTD